MYKIKQYVGVVTHYSREEINGKEIKTIVVALTGTDRSVDMIFMKGEKPFTSIGERCFGKPIRIVYKVDDVARREVLSVHCDQ